MFMGGAQKANGHAHHGHTAIVSCDTAANIDQKTQSVPRESEQRNTNRLTTLNNSSKAR